MTTPPDLALAELETASSQPLEAAPSPSSENDLEVLTRPLLEALARLAGLESTYLTIFDWGRREQEIRFVFSAGATRVEEGHRSPLPEDWSAEGFLGIIRSPQTLERLKLDSLIVRRLGLKMYVSVPVTIGQHRLFGMLCGASTDSHEVDDTLVNLMESFARMIADRVVLLEKEASETRAALAESQLVTRARFIAEAEHRLKAPLAALEGLSLTLRDRWKDLAPSERVEFHAGIVRNARLLSAEVENLLVEARAHIRSHELSPARLVLGPFVGSIVKAFDGLGPHHVTAEVSDGIAAFVDVDALQQILGHLLDNAIKYSPNGGRITVRVSEGEGSVVIDVIDEGIGLPSTVDVFEAFQRGDPQDGRTPGIGLGLHIVRSLVEAMKGRVTARSNPASGSTLTVTLPAAREP